MDVLDTARNNLAYASNRLTAAHYDLNTPAEQFLEALESCTMAFRAYHMAIRRTNLALSEMNTALAQETAPRTKDTPDNGNL